MNKPTRAMIKWIPRIMSITFIIFLMLFSLDVFEQGKSFWQILTGLLMHNVPAFVLLAVSIISWKREIVGGIVFSLFGVGYILTMAGPAFLRGDVSFGIAALWCLNIAVPAMLTGIFYIISWKIKS